MTLQPFEIRKFGGLNTVDDPHDIGWGQAVTATNVTLDNEGRLYPRPGTASFADLSCDSYQGPVAYSTVGGTDYLVAFCKTTSTKTTTLKYVDTGGSVSSATGAWTGASAAPTIGSITRYGVPTVSSVIFTALDGTTPQRAKYWSGSGAVADMPVSMKPLYVGVTPGSNRLVCAGYANAADSPSGANGSYSTVFFSNAGDPDTFTATDYVHLSPGDGEQITGVASYRDFLFVFKESKFFVFYGESTDETGGAVFNYRTVAIPVGRVATGGSLGASRCCAGADGVYFVAGPRIYKTDGGVPVRANETVESSFTWCPDPNVVACRDYVHVEPDTSAVPSTYVLDTKTGEWVSWSLRPPVDFNGSRYCKPMVGGDADLIVKLDEGVFTDYKNSGATTETMTAVYGTGYQGMSPPGTEGVVREVLFEGSGTLTAQLRVDDNLSTSASVSPTVTSLGRYRRTCRGRLFSVSLSATGNFYLNSVVANAQPARRGGAS